MAAGCAHVLMPRFGSRIAFSFALVSVSNNFAACASFDVSAWWVLSLAECPKLISNGGKTYGTTRRAYVNVTTYSETLFCGHKNWSWSVFVFNAVIFISVQGCILPIESVIPTHRHHFQPVPSWDFILTEIHTPWLQTYDIEIRHDYEVGRVDDAMLCKYTWFDRHDMHLIWKRQKSIDRTEKNKPHLKETKIDWNNWKKQIYTGLNSCATRFSLAAFFLPRALLKYRGEASVANIQPQCTCLVQFFCRSRVHATCGKVRMIPCTCVVLKTMRRTPSPSTREWWAQARL